MNDVDHRRLAADLSNHTWTLIERPQRTPDEDDEMLYSTFASACHWPARGGRGAGAPCAQRVADLACLSRASRVAGDAMTFDESVAQAREAGAQIADAEDREQFERTLAEIT